MHLHPNKVKGRLGVNYVERVALEAGCKPIPMPEDLDTGIDGFIEFTETHGVTPLIAFQVKRGTSFFDKLGAKYQADAAHLHYWSRYAIPVILIVVRDDESEAFWMDVRQYARDKPSLPQSGSSVLHLPLGQRFDPTALTQAVRELARPVEFGDAVAALSDSDVACRISALSLLYRFRMERRTPFCVAGAIHSELDLDALKSFCDFFSRYMSHPEASFAVAPELSTYARSLLAHLSRKQLLRVIAAFNDNDEFGDWSGATEIYGMSKDDIWDRHATIQRGTVQQGIAEIVGAAASPAELLSIIGDSSVPHGERRASVALFGYLGYSCDVVSIDNIAANEHDGALCALLTWLRYWLVTESTERD
jgi:hypothetical protein